MPTDERPLRLPETVGWGLALAVGTAIISGVAVYTNAIAVREFDDATLFTTLKNGVAAMGLAAVVLASAPARAGVRHLSGRQWLELGAIGILGGGLAFILFFNGLALASAPSAAFIHKTLFIWVAVLAVPLLGERFGVLQLGALAVLAGSQLLIAPMTGVSWGIGEALIALATGLWAVETILARHLLRDVPSSVGAAGRMGIGLCVLLGATAASGRGDALTALTATQWLWVLLTGTLLTAYVGTWYAALRRAPATAVTAILVLAAPITGALTVLAGGPGPLAPVGAGYVLALVGVTLTVLAVQRRRRAAEATR
ncbi:MAG TPA: DMT family transporter [Candidatus Limnocylindria bacterium]|jgi:drug/metabolite transporter (DMT)-like permease